MPQELTMTAQTVRSGLGPGWELSGKSGR